MIDLHGKFGHLDSNLSTAYRCIGASSPRCANVMKIKQNIDPLSLSSLQLCLQTGSDAALGTATGFIVKHKGRAYLATNLHVVSGKSPNTGQQISKIQCPDKLMIFHHVEERMRNAHGAWTPRVEPTVNESMEPLWHDHPNKDSRVFYEPSSWDELVIDVALLQLTETERIEIYDIEIPKSEPNIYIYPGLQVGILGYPFGKSAEMFPIWKTGHIASDFDDSINERYFLVDASTREGMSGSPVFFRPVGTYLDKNRAYKFGDGNKSYFMGVYSGRIHPDSDVGIVWRPKIILEILESIENSTTKAQQDGAGQRR